MVPGMLDYIPWEEGEQMMAPLVPGCVGQTGHALALHTKETEHRL